MASVAQPVPDGSRWADFSASGRPAGWYTALAEAGYTGVILDLATPGIAADFPLARAAGLWVQAFQGYWTPAWASSADATTRAQEALDVAQHCGYPPGAVVWCDFEAFAGSASAAIEWLNRWSVAVMQAGYRPGVYLGVPQPLSSEQAYADLILRHYWRASSASAIAVAVRGYQQLQFEANVAVAGYVVDGDVAMPDHLGGRVWGWPPDAGTSLAAEVAAVAQRVQAIQAALRQAGSA